MLRVGMIKQSSAGIYSWLPLGLKIMKKILVIGSAGYVGSVLIKHLKQKLDLNKYQILGVDTNWFSKNLELNKLF